LRDRQDQGVDVRIILRWNFRKWDDESIEWIDLAENRERWLTCECDNEPSGSIKCEECLE
jgi:hypothetical protein